MYIDIYIHAFTGLLIYKVSGSSGVSEDVAENCRRAIVAACGGFIGEYVYLLATVCCLTAGFSRARARGLNKRQRCVHVISSHAG